MDLQSVEIDVTNLDRSSIMYYIRSLYRMGYDEVRVNFKNPETMHYRLNKTMQVISVIHTEVNRLVGFEIVQQKENFCLVKDLSPNPSAAEFDNVLRRIFLLISDAIKDLVDAITNKNFLLAKTIEEKHDTITKFVSYCLRLLNKRGYEAPRKTSYLYHIIASLDRLVDILKYSARFFLEIKQPISKDGIIILTNIKKSVDIYADFFYKFNLSNVIELYKNRELVLNSIKKLSAKGKNISEKEILLLNDMEHTLEILVDLTEARMGLEY
jgi:phosphate uptake regulator